jgi:hypothetical protein
VQARITAAGLPALLPASLSSTLCMLRNWRTNHRERLRTGACAAAVTEAGASFRDSAAAEYMSFSCARAWFCLRYALAQYQRWWVTALVGHPWQRSYALKQRLQRFTVHAEHAEL